MFSDNLIADKRRAGAATAALNGLTEFPGGMGRTDALQTAHRSRPTGPSTWGRAAGARAPVGYNGALQWSRAPAVNRRAKEEVSAITAVSGRVLPLVWVRFVT